MKYIIICVSALIVCILISLLIVKLISRKKNIKVYLKILLAVLFTIVLLVSATLIYTSIYYHADKTEEYTSEKVKVTKIDGGYFYDGPEDDSALIFYPGAKVESLAYSSLMTRLAEKGIDCFLADMPLRMAVLGSDYADKFISSYSYEKWIVCGHSLGGSVISTYANSHNDVIDDIVLLASYPLSDMSENVDLISIYGSEDGILNKKSYEESTKYWPAKSSEYIIKGGNHAQFGNYGNQSGDNDAKISREDQQEQTVKIIIDSLKK